MAIAFTQRQRQLLTLAMVTVVLAADLAISYGNFDETKESGTVSHGDLASFAPPEIHRSETFARLGSVALNLTPCLHGTSENPYTGFTCEHDIFSAYMGAHENGDHFGSAYGQFRAYYDEKYAADPGHYDALGIDGGDALMRDELRQHGITEPVINAVCGAKDPLRSTLDLLPSATLGSETLDISALPMEKRILLSSICRFAPYFAEDTYGEADYHEQHDHEHEDSPVQDPLSRVMSDGSDVMGAPDAAGAHGHGGPHGIDFNSELNWVYSSLSHQGKVAMVNLNVVDWGKVATYEDATGYRVILFDDEAMFSDESILYYASKLLTEGRGREVETAEALDAIHRYCFDRSKTGLFNRVGAEAWRDSLDLPSGLQQYADALAFFGQHTTVPVLTKDLPTGHRPGAQGLAGWSCFLAFTGIDARPWVDPTFINPFCTFDTRHMGRFDAKNSPGSYSRSNPGMLGDGDAWRCDWFVRYVNVTKDIDLTVRRRADTIENPGLPLLQEEHRTWPREADEPLDAHEQYIEVLTQVSIGPHDLVYNPTNGLVYVTHYWQFSDPDIRLLPDWTIHVIDQNPASDSFNNPYDSIRGPTAFSCYGTRDPDEQFARGIGVDPRPSDHFFTHLYPARMCAKNNNGSATVLSESYPVDVGGPIDALHPVTVDVDVPSGRVFLVNRESNTISVLHHNGIYDFESDPAKINLQGPKRIAIDYGPDTVVQSPRDFSLHRGDADGPLTAREKAGYFTLLPDQETIREEDPMAATRPVITAMVRRVLEDRTVWPAIVGDFRNALAAADFDIAETAFFATWGRTLEDAKDRAAFREAFLRVAAATDAVRPDVLARELGRLDAHLPGRLSVFVDELVGLTDTVTFLDGAADVRRRWTEAASKGTLTGLAAPGFDEDSVVAAIDATAPILAATFASGSAAWLDYCVRYSADDWIFHLAEGKAPGEPQGKEAENGFHHFHCDDVYPIHYPDRTPIQVDFVGTSNNHEVFIIREPIGPLLMDYWYETRPRILQPFDIWVNSGDGSIYISNLGNHDNVPLVNGWLSIIQPGAKTPCHIEESHAQEPFRSLANSMPRTTCIIPPMIRSGFSANLLLSMDLMPHHLNVNPYTFEVYGGHLMSDYIMAAQLEVERESWAIPKAHIFGSDVVPGAAAVPNPNPTGMGVNPSSQRLFMTHFMVDEPQFIPFLGRDERIDHYTGIVDLRNYSLVNDLIPVGDHHVVVDLSRSPGRGFYEQPFYNRTVDLNIGGRSVIGNPVLVGDTAGTMRIFNRCTYYSAEVGPTAFTPGFFDAGRCYNLFELQPWEDGVQPVYEDESAYEVPVSSGPRRVYQQPTDSNVYWEVGFENLNFGVLNFFIDPDNVPANLRVLQPHARDRDRFVDSGLQVTEELASAWVTVDTRQSPKVPHGDLPFAIDLSAAELPPAASWDSREEYFLGFDTAYVVEPGARPRPEHPDRMTVGIADSSTLPERAADITAVTTVADWDAASANAAWHTIRIPIGNVPGTDPGSTVRIVLDFDSGDAIANAFSGWTVAGAAIENRDPLSDGSEPEPRATWDLPDADMTGIATAMYASPAGALVPAVGFRDAVKGTYDVGGATGRAVINVMIPDGVEDPVLVLTQRQVVEDADLVLGTGKPMDTMAVEVSVDDGITWKRLWNRDSRDAPLGDITRTLANVTNLVQVMTMAARTDETRPHGAFVDVSESTLRFRFRFDAVDPVANEYPGWLVANVDLVRASRSASGELVIDQTFALPDPVLATPDVSVPSWRPVSNDPFFGEIPGGSGWRFMGADGTYATAGSLGGASGLVCRLDHLGFGTWAGRATRGPGAGGVTYHARDLAGQVTELLHQTSRGPALVEDSFQNAGFTENYWARETMDPHGVAAPAYVFDPLMDGMGDVLPEDTPNDFRSATVDAAVNPGTGEHVIASRPVLVEIPPKASNRFADVLPRLVTEAAAFVDDGIQQRRGFLMAPGDPNAELLPDEYRKVLVGEGAFLNASHVNALRPATPILTTLTQVNAALAASREGMGEGMGTGGAPGVDLEAITAEFLRAGKTALLGRQWGVRDPPVDQYVTDAVPHVPVEASETLSHTFRVARDNGPATSVDLAFDFVVRHRFEDYIVDALPALPRIDLELLDFMVNNVTMDKLDLAQKELDVIIGESDVARDTFLDARWLANHTLADLGYTVASFADVLLPLLTDLIKLEVPVSEILNDLDRLQMSLPTFGAGHSVKVVIVRPNGTSEVLAERTSYGTDRPVTDFTPMRPGADARVSFLPAAADGRYDVRLGMDVGRFEKVRMHFEEADASRLFPVTGDYTIRIETGLRSADRPAPGVIHEVDYGHFLFHVGVTSTNEAPDPSFTWRGPVGVGAAAGFRTVGNTATLANQEDPDGHVASYEWTFPAAAVSRVTLGGHTLVPDSDAGILDDRVTNAAATGWSATVRHLTMETIGDNIVLRYDVNPCSGASPAATFDTAGEHAVTLRVTDDKGAMSTLTQLVTVGASRRAPELVDDPFVHDGKTWLTWQENPGSLMLGTHGRTFDLNDPTGIPQQVIDDAVMSSEAFAQAIFDDPLTIPDVILENLLIRPSTVTVVSRGSEAAAGGMRSQVLLGDMPAPRGLLVNTIAGAEAMVHAVQRGARSGGIPSIEVDPEAFKNGITQDLDQLFRQGILDAWMFTLSLHPDDGAGNADLTRTVARATIADSGIGYVILTGYDGAERVITYTVDTIGDALDGIDEAVSPHDPILTLVAYDALADGIRSNADEIRSAVPVLEELLPELALPDVPLGDVLGVIDDLGIDGPGLAAITVDLEALRELLDEADATTHARINELETGITDLLDTADAELAQWASNPVTDLSLAPKRTRIADARADLARETAEARAQAALLYTAADGALASLEQAVAALNEVVDSWANLVDAQQAVTDAIAEANAAAADAAKAVDAIVHASVEIVRRIDPRRIVDDAPEAISFDDADDQPVNLAYDSDTGSILIRIGDTVLHQGTVDAPSPGTVHAAISFTSLADHNAEVQGLWGVRGATLRDGFNRNAVLDPAQYDVIQRMPPDGVASAAAVLVETGTVPAATKQLHITGSAEGFNALDRDARNSRVNDRRSEVGTHVAAPGSLAATFPDRIIDAQEARAAAVALQAATGIANPAATGVLHAAPLTGTVDGILHEFRVAPAGTPKPSAPAIDALPSPPPAPHILDVTAHVAPGGGESLEIAFQPGGISRAPVTSWTAYVSPRPDGAGPAVPLDVLVEVLSTRPTDPDWRAGVEYQRILAAAPPAFAKEWRYLTVRGTNAFGEGAASPSYRLPPLVLEERFAQQPQGPLADGYSSVDAGTGEIVVDAAGVVGVRLDTCLGDKVEVTRDLNFPHDQILGSHARALRIREGGLDGLLSFLSQLGQSLDSVPLDLVNLDKALLDVDLSLCPSLKDLRDIIDADSPDTILQALGITTAKPDDIPNWRASPLTGDGGIEAHLAWTTVAKRLYDDLTIDLDVNDILYGTPATVTWRTPEINEPYSARVRFLVPGIQLGLFNGLIPGERFHLLQLGHDDGTDFTEVLRVDLDPHVLAPLDPEGTVTWLDDIAGFQKDAIGAIATGDLPLSYGIAAGDTRTNKETVAAAAPDQWYTVEVYAAGAGADLYSVAIDGRWVGQFRTSSSLAPNALRIGGSHVPFEVVVDDVRFGKAIHPPIPQVEVVKAPEHHDFATVRWHMPESGGAPFKDFNLLRLDLDDPGATPEVVATTGAGMVRSITDPLSHDQPAGKRFAYSVQAVSDMPPAPGRRRVSGASDAHGITLPAFVPVARDTDIVHAHANDRYDGVTNDGQSGVYVGSIDERLHRAVFHVNLSGMTDASGRALGPGHVGEATLLTYALQHANRSTSAPSLLPSIADIMRTLGYNSELAAAAGPVVQVDSLSDANELAESLSPGIGTWMTDVYGEEAYATYLGGLMGTRVTPFACPDIVQSLAFIGHACLPADEEPRSHFLCPDVSRDLELTFKPFNCHANAIGAYVSDSTAYDTASLAWNNQPRTDYWTDARAIDRQSTRSETWRRYDLTGAAQADDDGDFTVTLKKEIEQTPTALVRYAASEARTWLDDILGSRKASLLPWLDGAGPDAFPWTDATASRGSRAVVLGDSSPSKISSVKIGTDGIGIVPFDVPIKMDVFIPEGEAPREIGLRIVGDVTTRSRSSAGRSCGVYGGFAGLPALVTWGDELVVMDANGNLRLDHDGELGYLSDLQHPRENLTGLHVGGIPVQRGRWVTLTFDPGQLALEVAAQRAVDDPGLIRIIFDALRAFRGPDTSLWLPNHLDNPFATYQRERPTTFTERVDSIGGGKDIADHFPYDYHIPKWTFLWQNYDKFVEPWHCGLSMSSIELFSVGGTVLVDRVGPDISPRVRVDAIPTSSGGGVE